MITTDYTDSPEWNTTPHKEIITFYFKHHRDNDDKMFATSCKFVNQDNKTVAIGLALCSDKDNFNRKIGRDISYRRGLKAYLSKMNHFPIRERECPVVKKSLDYIGLNYKASYFGKE